MGVLTNVFLGALAGYSFAKLKFRGRKVTFSLLLSSMMIPGVITMIPQFLVLKNFPLVGGNNIFGQGGQGLHQPLCGYYSAGCSRSLCSLLYETVF